jgi:hypothetical protein
MPIKLAEQVILCGNGVTRINRRGKELALALLAPCHCGNLAFVSQENDVALCHAANSLAQFQELHHSETRVGASWRLRLRVRSGPLPEAKFALLRSRQGRVLPHPLSSLRDRRVQSFAPWNRSERAWGRSAVRRLELRGRCCAAPFFISHAQRSREEQAMGKGGSSQDRSETKLGAHTITAIL